jgi:hypothetical protein
VLSLALSPVAWAEHHKPPPTETVEREPPWEPTEGGYVAQVRQRGTPFGDFTRLPIKTIRNGQPTNRIGAGTLRPGQD